VRPVLGQVSSLSLILLVLLLSLANIKNVLDVFGTGAILAGIFFILLGFGIGWVLGGVPSYSIVGIVASQYLVDFLNLFSQGSA
jgi:hypothetical protein